MDQQQISNLSYEQALEKLENIVTEIEQGNISIDQLASKIAEAKALFEYCMAKLTTIEKDVSNILKKMPDNLSDTPQNQ